MRLFPGTKDKVIIGLILLSGFIIMHRLFRPGIPAYLDNPGHFIEAWMLSGYLIPIKHWFSGWVSVDFAGFPMFMYYPYPLGFFVIYLLQSLPFISLVMAYKLILVFSYVFPAIALYSISKRYGTTIAVITSLFWMLNIYILELVLGGMWSISLSMVPFIFFIADIQTLQQLENKQTYSKIIKYSFLLATILLLHYYTFIIAALFILSYLLHASFYRRFDIIRILLVSVILAILYDGFFIWNIWDSSGWASSSVFWENSLYYGLKTILFPYQIGIANIIDFIINKQYLEATIIVFKQLTVNSTNFFVLLFGAIGIWNIKDRINRNSIIFLIIILFLILIGILNTFKELPLIQNLQPRRFIILFQVLFLIFMPAGIYYIFSSSGSKNKIRYFANKIYEKKIIVLLLAMLFVSSEYYTFENTLQLGYTTEEFPEAQNILEMFKWIKEIDEPTRIYYQSTYESGLTNSQYWFDQSKFMPFAVYYTGKPALGAWSIGMPYPTQKNIETTGNALFGRPIKDLNPDYVAYSLKGFNAKYIMVITNDSKNLLNDTNLFTLQRTFGIFNVYSLNNYTPTYIYAENSIIELRKFVDEEIEFNITGAENVNLKIQYHPYWTGFVDGKAIKIEKNELNLMKIALPDREKHHVRMVFSQPIIPGLMLSIAGLLILITLIIISIIKNKNNV